MNKCIEFVQRKLFPPLCVLCGAAGDPEFLDLCAACSADLPRAGTACPCCARPLAGAARRCGHCLRRPPPFHHTIAALRYQRPVDTMIQRLKFEHRLVYARLLSAVLLDRVRRTETALPAALLPVPLHPARQRQRGFNQAVELARPLGKALGMPMLRNCRRVRATHTQSLLSGRDRWLNLRDAFAVQGPLPGHVAIVDDVVTTGSTVHALARCLRAAGVGRVEVWCVARAAED